ncbi:retron St85 family effector protein [Methylomonas sp. 11b]|uniref:retron St85 family effector protein n=1 Tax=Methylomonas sp. 11b TaxID=1168169 RepID=UPI00047A50B5|nr:retron St85 family effector protein [Methylomonas sp. 11b]
MQEDSSDFRAKLLSTIDFSKSRVEFSETPIVLLCGGQVAPPKNNPDDPDPPVKSLRDAISRSHAKYEIFRPEEISSWDSDGIFKDLLAFETDLANICSLVVIILESAGSLVELGAFTQIVDVNKRVIAIRSSEFDNEKSFINLGILRCISERNESGVKSYPWEIRCPHSITDEVVCDVIVDIEKELDKQKKSEVLRFEKSAHIFVLICEIIKYFAALKEHEVFDYLILIGISITKEQLKSKLFLLERFRIIIKKHYSDSIFYLHSSQGYHRLRICLNNGDYPDTFRISVECIDYYNSENLKHRHRLRVIKQVLGVSG